MFVLQNVLQKAFNAVNIKCVWVSAYNFRSNVVLNEMYNTMVTCFVLASLLKTFSEQCLIKMATRDGLLYE